MNETIYIEPSDDVGLGFSNHFLIRPYRTKMFCALLEGAKRIGDVRHDYESGGGFGDRCSGRDRC